MAKLFDIRLKTYQKSQQVINLSKKIKLFIFAPLDLSKCIIIRYNTSRLA